MRIKVVDLNRSLIKAVKKARFDAEWADYFSSNIKPNEVLITASNPQWTFGGGIDAVFQRFFPEVCYIKQDKGGGMERIADIVFSITVDENLKSTPEIVEKAIRFGLSTLKKGEVLRLSGLGTGIGGLSINSFVEILEKIRDEA